jgi:hypothetical protein
VKFLSHRAEKAQVGAQERRTVCFDGQSNLCYTNFDAEQDHDCSGDGCRADGGSHGVRRAIVHPGQRAKSEGLPASVLWQYDVLRHVAEEYSSFVAAARQE